MEDQNKGNRYHWFGLLGLLKETPENWISAKPVRIFGICIGYWITLAKKGYVWGDGRVQE